MRSKQEAVSERVRTPAVAGLFYPGEAEVLRENVRRLLRDNPATGAAPKAVIVPHAGYVYSGPVAARAGQHLEAASHQAGGQWPEP